MLSTAVTSATVTAASKKGEPSTKGIPGYLEGSKRSKDAKKEL
jgi:hypothetical protein